MGMDAGLRIWYGANLEHESVDWDIRGKVQEAVEELRGEDWDDPMLPGIDDARLVTHYPADSSELVGVGIELFYKDWDYKPWTVEEMLYVYPTPKQQVVLERWLADLGVPDEAVGTWAHTLFW